jgi:hypothetical protein
LHFGLLPAKRTLPFSGPDFVMHNVTVSSDVFLAARAGDVTVASPNRAKLIAIASVSHLGLIVALLEAFICGSPYWLK